MYTCVCIYIIHKETTNKTYQVLRDVIGGTESAVLMMTCSQSLKTKGVVLLFSIL